MSIKQRFSSLIGGKQSTTEHGLNFTQVTPTQDNVIPSSSSLEGSTRSTTNTPGADKSQPRGSAKSDTNTPSTEKVAAGGRTSSPTHPADKGPPEVKFSLTSTYSEHSDDDIV